MGEKYMLKAFKIDPAEGGVVKASTRLYPFYALATDFFDTVNNGRDAVAKGKGVERDVTDQDDMVIYRGRDDLHGASGLHYPRKGAVMFTTQLGGEDGKLEDGRYYTNVFHNDPTFVIPDSARHQLGLDIKRLMAGASHYGHRGLDPVLMLVGVPDGAVVTDDDVKNFNWDAWRDSPNELQVKSYVPREQVPWGDYKGDVEKMLKEWFDYYDAKVISDECMKDVICGFKSDVDGLYRQRHINGSLIRGLGV